MMGRTWDGSWNVPQSLDVMKRSSRRTMPCSVASEIPCPAFFYCHSLLHRKIGEHTGHSRRGKCIIIHTTSTIEATITRFYCVVYLHCAVFFAHIPKSVPSKRHVVAAVESDHLGCYASGNVGMRSMSFDSGGPEILKRSILYKRRSIQLIFKRFTRRTLE